MRQSSSINQEEPALPHEKLNYYPSIASNKITPLKYLSEEEMEAKMSRTTGRELLSHARKRYIKACWREKSRILDEFICLTGYDRKYGIKLLNLVDIDSDAKKTDKKRKNKKYDGGYTPSPFNNMGCS